MSFFKTRTALALGLVLCLCILPGGVLASAEMSAANLTEGGMTLPAPEAISGETPLPAESSPAEDAGPSPVADGAGEPAGVAIDSNHFPDEIFRNLVAGDYDENGDGYLSPAEAAVQGMDCAAMGIADLTGIGCFTALEYLYCDSNRLERLDVSVLTSLKGLDCSQNGLKELDVSGCGELRELWVQGNDLEMLDLTGNPALEKSLAAANLTEQDGVESWGGTGIASLKNDSGVKITLAEGIVLNRGSVPDDMLRLLLRDGIDADGNGYMPRSEAEELTELECAGWDIADFTGLGLFPKLTRLDCRDTAIETLDLREMSALETVYLEGERIEGEGFFVYLHEETDGLLMVDAGIPVRTEKGGADVDRDGDTDPEDALAVLRHAVGTDILTGSGLAAADADGNNVADARDAVQILRFVSGRSSVVR